jgi:LCP family protein required for cell wall assembly
MCRQVPVTGTPARSLGQDIRLRDPADDASATLTRRRLGDGTGYFPSPSLAAANPATEGIEYRKLPAEPVTTGSRKRRRSRKPWYRRPVTTAIVAVLAVVIVVTGYIGFQVQAIMTSVHSYSTPPPVVTDNTFTEEGDPETAQVPISVDTSAAREYLEQQRASGELPEEPAGGFAGAFGSLGDNTGEIIQGGAAAVGLAEGEQQPITMMVLGVDARPGEAIDIGVRPDVITILRLDPATSSCRALSIPRDTRVDLPGYGDTKINHALMVGGIPYQLRVTEEFLGIDIDHYLLIDFVAFQQVVDTLGGISVDVPEDLYKNDTKVFSEGTQEFDGTTALSYARYRSFDTSGDLGRVERQWGVVKGIAEIVRGRDLVGVVNNLLPTLQNHIRTDLEAVAISDIVSSVGSNCASASMEDIAMVRGARTDLTDEMLGEIQSFNVVSPSSVAEQVDILMGATSPDSSPVQAPEIAPPSGTPQPNKRARSRDIGMLNTRRDVVTIRRVV